MLAAATMVPPPVIGSNQWTNFLRPLQLALRAAARTTASEEHGVHAVLSPGLPLYTLDRRLVNWGQYVFCL